MNKLSVFCCDTSGIYYWASLTTLALLWFLNIPISFLPQASNTLCFLRKSSLFSFWSVSSATVTSSERTFLTTMFKDLSSATSSAAAKSRQSCPTLCDPRDGSPPRSPVPGILRARTLEWGAIAFSNA